MKVLIVGDVHGEWGKLNTLINKKKPDIILSTGDFGWWPQMAVRGEFGYEKGWELEGVKPQGSKVYWCDGNHEDHWSIQKFTPDNPTYPIELYKGVNYMPRGSILELPDGRTILFVGGADSVDKNQRFLGVDWFPEEMPNYNEIEHILNHRTRIDIVISHTCPQEWLPRSTILTYDKNSDPTRKMLSEVLDKYKPKLWYHGHWHVYNKGYTQGCHWTSLDHSTSRQKWWEWLP